MELAYLSAESCLLPHPVLAQEKKATQTQKSTESAEEAVMHATGAALQENAASAVKILLSVPASAFAGDDAEWRSCMIDRFGSSGKPAAIPPKLAPDRGHVYQAQPLRVRSPELVGDAKYFLS